MKFHSCRRRFRSFRCCARLSAISLSQRDRTIVRLLLIVTMILLTGEASSAGRRVYEPRFGDIWFIPGTYPIRWDTDSFVSNVKIELHMGERYVLTIASDHGNTGSYFWDVPEGLVSRGDYRIKMVDATDGTNSLFSGHFRIVGDICHEERSKFGSIEHLNSWSIHTVDVGNVGYCSSISLDTQNRPHISYYDANAAHLKHAYWDGSVWQTEIVDHTDNVGTWTSIAVDESNHVHISYCHEQNRDLKYARWDGSSWHLETVDDAGNRGQYTSIALDGMRHPHISYIYGGAGDLMYAFHSGVMWGTHTVDDERDTGRYTSIALDANDYPHISYHDYTWYRYYLKYAYYNGSAWVREWVDQRFPSGYYTSIAVDTDSFPPQYRYISSQGLSHCDYYHWTPGTGWQHVPVEPHAGTLYVAGTSIALDEDRRPHICYYRASSDSARCLRYAYWNGSIWVTETVDGGDTRDVGGNCSLILDDYGYSHVSYIDYTNGSLRYATKKVGARMWYVHPDSVLNSIQAALDSCSTADTVLVAAGTYYENLVWPNTQGIKLISESGPDTTIIDGGGTARVITVTTAVDSATIISGFIIRNGSTCRGSGGYYSLPTTAKTAAPYGAGIYCKNSSPTITGNTITGNTAVSGGGIHCDSSSSPIITDNIITGNTVTDTAGGGICCYNNSSPTITGNTVSGNTAVYGGGILCAWESSPTITGNIITENSTYDHSGGGIYCYYFSSPTITGNTITNNTGDNNGGGVVCFDYSSPIISGNTITDNVAGFGGGGIFCWNNSSPTIAGNTISGNTAENYGGGIYCGSNSSPAITNNAITGNTANHYGAGGIFCWNNSSPTIIGDTIAGNTANTTGGGIDCSTNSSPIISSNAITGNTARDGGGIDCRTGSSPTITGNTVTGNSVTRYGGAIACWDTSSAIITGNRIMNNTADWSGGGIACMSHSSPTIDSCTISSNNGDGVYCDSASSPEIHYCNISDNTGYGVQNVDSSVTVDAEYNWWGHESGPYHPVTNPGGLGDSVSDYVDYDPWTVGVSETASPTSPVQFILFQNCPNPFAFRTAIAYQLPMDGEVSLKIYNLSGQLVRSLVDTRKEAGYHKVNWNGQDDSGKQVVAGVYLCRMAIRSIGSCGPIGKVHPYGSVTDTGLETGEHKSTKKMIYVR